MKKLALIFLLITPLTVFSSISSAVEVEGTIQEIRVCARATKAWTHMTMLKMSGGEWVGMYSNYGQSADYDLNHSFSLLMSAYTSRLKVKLSGTYPPQTHCGITPVMVIGNNTNNYVAIIEYNQ